MIESKGICTVCGEVRSVTARGNVRMHLEPVAAAGTRWRANCAGSGKPPRAEENVPHLDMLRDWSPEVRGLAEAYNRMHNELCRRGSFCSHHMEGFVLAACIQDGWPDPDPTKPRVYRGPLPQPGPCCPCFYPELDPEDSEGTMCNCGHAMDEHGDDGNCTITEET